MATSSVVRQPRDILTSGKPASSRAAYDTVITGVASYLLCCDLLPGSSGHFRELELPGDILCMKNVMGWASDAILLMPLELSAFQIKVPGVSSSSSVPFQIGFLFMHSLGGSKYITAHYLDPCHLPA